MKQSILLVDPKSQGVPVAEPDGQPFELDWKCSPNPAEALDRISRERFDAVVYSLEDRADVETVEQLRRRNPELPILALVEERGVHLKSEALAAGADLAVERDGTLERVPKTVTAALRALEGLRKTRAELKRASATAGELENLARENSRLIEKARGTLADPATLVALPDLGRFEDPSLRLAEAWRLLMENVRDFAIFMTDADGRIASWNEGAQKLFGYDVREMIGAPLERIFTPEDVERGVPRREIEKSTSDGRVEDDTWMLRKDGTRFWGAGVLTALRCEDGRLVGFAKLVRDLTELKTSEERAREASRRLRFVIDSIPMLVAYVARDGRCLVGNDGCAEWLGVPKSRLEAATLWDVWKPDSFPELRERVRRALADGSRKDEIALDYGTDGSRRWLRVLLLPQCGPGGNAEGVLVVAVDVTGRHRTLFEERLLADLTSALASSAEPDRLLSSAAEVLAAEYADWCLFDVLEEDGALVRRAVAHRDPETCAAMRLRLLGRRLDPEAPLGAPQAIRTGEAVLYKKLTRSDVEAVGQDPEHVEALLDMKPRSALIVPLRTQRSPMGALVLVWTESQHVCDDRDLALVQKLAYRVAATMENSRLYEKARLELAERRRAEEALRVLNEDLELRVRERTADLEASLTELDTLAYSLAHDLRSPLRAMAGFGDILAEDYRGKPLDEEGAQFAGRIGEAARRMDDLLMDLLKYTRVTCQEVELAPIDLVEVIRQAIGDLREEIGRTRAKVEVASVMPRVLGQATLLRQAVGELLSNAIKFVPPGGQPVVSVGAEKRGGRIQLWIKDNGIGIRPEYQGRVFGVFERLHDREGYSGTGMGLAIVRRAVERMEGTVGFDSEVGRGTRFWIELDDAELGQPHRTRHRAARPRSRH